MTVADRGVVDAITNENESSEVILYVFDHLDWDDPKNVHLKILQDKINDHPSFIESGELQRQYPTAGKKKRVIEVSGKSDLNQIAREFYKKASQILCRSNVDLRFKQSLEYEQ